jgi:hypothetical protein
LRNDRCEIYLLASRLQGVQWKFGEALEVILCPEGGYRAQPRVSTLGTLNINEFALKLKGREADLIKLAPMATPTIGVRN